MKVAFIGLGIMGSRMAANLLKKGYSLVVYNRTKEKAQPLIQAGAVWANTPAEAARQADVLITMLANPTAVREVALGPDGFLPAVRPNSLWMDCSTVNPSFTREMADEAHERQMRFIDAPVTGSRIPAEKAQLTFLVGGSNDDIQEVQPLMDVMGQKTIHAGGVGMGTSLKLVFNLMLAVSMLSFSEALVLGEALGIGREMILDALQGSAVTAPFTAAKRQKVESGDFSPDFPLKLMQKDLEMVAVSGYEAKAALPLSNAAKEVYALAIRYGLGEDDFSAIYRFLSERKDGSQ